MAYVEYSGREDMQDDMYRIISQYVILATQAYADNDERTMHRIVDILFLLTWKKLDAESAKTFETRIMGVANMIYDDQAESSDELRRTAVLDELRHILKDLNGELTDRGLLYRMKADLDNIVTRRPDG